MCPFCDIARAIRLERTGSRAARPAVPARDGPETFGNTHKFTTRSPTKPRTPNQQNTHFKEIAASRLKGIEMMANLKVRPKHGVPNARAALGASEYQRCVSHDSHPSAAYNTSDHEALREDLLFDISRDEYPAVTAYNDSKALLAEVTCEAAPPQLFTDTEVCTSVEGFCDLSCEMPVPDHCITGDKSFGTCEPTVNHICSSIEKTHTNCEQTQRQSIASEDRYNKHEVGTPPCRVDADAPSPRLRTRR